MGGNALVRTTNPAHLESKSLAPDTALYTSELHAALSGVIAEVVSAFGHDPEDAGSKAISRDFGMPVVKDRPAERVAKLSEEHTLVDTEGEVRIGELRQVLPAHCCATMNLHRSCVAVRGGRVEAVWPVEASGRYD